MGYVCNIRNYIYIRISLYFSIAVLVALVASFCLEIFSYVRRCGEECCATATKLMTNRMEPVTFIHYPDLCCPCRSVTVRRVA